MDDKNNKSGFSGLSGLTSDAGGIPRDDSQQEGPSTAAPQKKVFSLLELTKWPSLPAPWSSADDGETWVWGDFFFTFQKKPITVLDMTVKMQGKEPAYKGLIYHYAMSAYYHVNKNPHGQSIRPIMTIGLEQVDHGLFEKMTGVNTGDLAKGEPGSKMGPLMIGLFTNESRFNLGKYEGDISPQTIKKVFFEILGRDLGCSGQPNMIGNLAQAHGHPETGLPARNKKAGCASVILLFIGIGSLVVWGLSTI